MKRNSLELNRTIPDRPLVLYHCGYEQCMPSHSFGPAIRPHYLIHFIKHGQGTYYVNGAVHHLKAGEGFLIHPGVTTLYAADDKDPWEYCWIGFDGYDAAAVLQGCGLSQTSLILRDHSNGILWEDLMTLINMFSERQGNEFTYLGLLYRCFSHTYQPLEPSSEPVWESYLGKAMEYIHNNYSYDIKISDIAKLLSIDRTYLYKLFMADQEISPQQYLINYRIKISQRLLKETNLSMTEVAYSCGFRDASSFNKHFKKRLETTPLKYRAGR